VYLTCSGGKALKLKEGLQVVSEKMLQTTAKFQKDPQS
jgi:hypothetical protein